MIRLSATLLLAVVLCGCRAKESEKAAITPIATEKKPATATSWLSALKQPVTIRIEGLAEDAEAIKPFVALGERYRKVKPDVTVTTATSAARRIEIGYGPKTVALGPQDGVLFSDVTGTSYLIARTLHEAHEAAEGVKHRIGFLVGSKQPGLDALKEDFAKTHPSYALEPVEVYDKGNGVPADLEALIVAPPREPVDSKKMRRIDEFLMRGRSVAILTGHGELHDADPSMNVKLGKWVISELLEGYGLTPSSSLAIDKRAVWTVPSAKKGAKPEVYPFVVLADASKGAFDDRMPALFALQTVPLLLASELTVVPERATRNGTKVKTLVRTSDQLLVVDGSTISAHPSPDRIGNGATKQHTESRSATLAVTLEGPIGSAFDKTVAAGGRARLLVMSATGFLGNAFREAGRSPFAGSMPGMDPNLGEDEELLEFAKRYDALVPLTVTATGRICDWLVRRDEQVEP